MSMYVMFGNKTYSKLMMTKFIIVDIPLTYNAFIGQPMTYHVMKFSIKTSIRELRSNLKESCTAI